MYKSLGRIKQNSYKNITKVKFICRAVVKKMLNDSFPWGSIVSGIVSDK